MFKYFCIILLVISTSLSAQVDHILNDSLDTKPSYKLGYYNLLEFIAHNLKYPHYAAERSKLGTAIISFWINIDGTIDNIESVNKIDPMLEKEAIRVIKLTDGSWKPGIDDGIAVKSYFEVPIVFLLQEPSIKSLDYCKKTGDISFDYGHYRRAIKFYSVIRERKPYDLQYLNKLAYCYWEIGKIEMACYYWKRIEFLKSDISNEYVVGRCNKE